MKIITVKRSCLSLLACLIVFCAFPRNAHAMGIGVGGTVWYTFWQPAFEDWMLDKSNFLAYTMKGKYIVQPQFFGGPNLMLKFNDRVSWTNAFFFSRYNTRASIHKANMASISSGSANNASNYINLKFKTPIWKFDVDSTVTIKIRDFFSVFVGLKFQKYDYQKKTNAVFGSGAYIIGKDKVRFDSPGMGLGMGFNINLVENLFLIMNMSALYQLAIVRYSNSGYLVGTQNGIPIVLPMGSGRVSWYLNNGVGANATLSFAYYIPVMKTTLALGFRYQGIYYFDGGAPSNRKVNDNNFDHFYGATFSFVYSFDTGKKAEES